MDHFAGEDASTEPTPPKTSIGWTKESTPLPPLSNNPSSGLNLNVHATSAGLESPASISPIRSGGDGGKGIANGHHHGSSFSHFQPAQLSGGDLNDNLLDHNGSSIQQHSSSSLAAERGVNVAVKSEGLQQRISSSSSTGSSSSSSSHPLFLFGMCRWPGCEMPCEDYSAFVE